MAEVRFFNKDKDYNTIAKWWIEHDQIPCPINLLPTLGFIVDDLVVGFIYQSDSKAVFFESIVSKKDSDKEQRREALNSIIDLSCKASKEMGYERLIFHTSYPGLKELAVEWGCKPYLNTTERFYKDLREEV